MASVIYFQVAWCNRKESYTHIDNRIMVFLSVVKWEGFAKQTRPERLINKAKQKHNYKPSSYRYPVQKKNCLLFRWWMIVMSMTHLSQNLVFFHLWLFWFPVSMGGADRLPSTAEMLICPLFLQKISHFHLSLSKNIYAIKCSDLSPYWWYLFYCTNISKTREYDHSRYLSTTLPVNHCRQMFTTFKHFVSILPPQQVPLWSLNSFTIRFVTSHWTNAQAHDISVGGSHSLVVEHVRLF